MDTKKPTQQGQAPQPEQKKVDTKPVQTSAQQPQFAPPQQSPEQKAEAERKEQIAKIAQEMAARATEQPKGPDPKEVAALALKAVEQKRAAELAAAPADGATSTQTSGKRDRWPERKKKSTIANPVKFVWDLADAMKKVDPSVRRKDVIEAAIANGVAGYTARTQYQAWYQMQRESQRQAALQEAKRAAEQKTQKTG